MAIANPPVFEFPENEARDPDDFCASTNAPTSLPAIHFIGGGILEPQVDPTKGVPTTCGLTLDLVGQLQSALSPFQPVLTILDAVSQIAQCFLLTVEVITNPFKIPDLLACIPGLISKVNAILALVPVFPQGIIQFITMVVDTIRFVGQQIDCVVQILTSIQEEFAQLGLIAQQINEVDDLTIKEGLQTLLDCGTAEANQQASVATAALGPVARILCTIRGILSLVPGGAQIAQQMAFPDPSNIGVLEDAIAALEATRDILLGFVQVIEAIALPFGGILPPPEIGFSCPLDEPQPAEIPEVALAPTITSITPASVPATFDATVEIAGTNFSSDSKVFWGTALVTGSNGSVSFSSETLLLVTLEGTTLLNATGKFQVSVVNEPPGGAEAFSGLASTAGGAVNTGVEVSNLFEVEVT